MARVIHTIKENEEYGLWIVLSKVDGLKIEKWVCRCACGTVKDVFKSHLYRLESTSCGCVGKAKITRRNTSHGLSGTKENRTWASMKKRCSDTESKDYKDYGERGITVCDEWSDSFTTFLDDMDFAPKDGNKWSIGRLDNDVGYCKENCRWEIDSQQARNKTMLVTNTSGKCGVGVRVRDGRASFTAFWVDLNGKKHNREFSAGKYGRERARKMAEDARDSAIAYLNSKGAEYSPKHGL